MADAVAASIVTQTVVQNNSNNPRNQAQQNAFGQNTNKKKDKNKNKKIRTAGGVAWEDPTLAEWEDGELIIIDWSYKVSS